jgi:ArsR family transcriptional regulator, arsenate/arsenite/antimonite-responsive transcriptional repressor
MATIQTIASRTRGFSGTGGIVLIAPCWFGDDRAPLFPTRHRSNAPLDSRCHFDNSGSMKSNDALACLNALAQEHRLNLYRLLVQAGEEGLAVGELAAATGLAGATLTNHLHVLRRAGMVSDERRGRVIQCRANYPQMNDLLGFLSENCCAGSASAGCAPATTCPPARSKR